MKRILVKRFLSLILSLCMILEGNLVGGMDVLAASVEPTENTTDSALVDSFEENSEDAFLAETAEQLWNQKCRTRLRSRSRRT